MQDGLKRVLDYSDHLAAPEDGKRYEILQGNLLVTPAPRPVHQRVLLRLAAALREHFSNRGGEVFIAPIDLILTDHDVLQPDLLVVDDPATITTRGIEGPPLLVVEILSTSTAERDRGVKAQRSATGASEAPTNPSPSSAETPHSRSQTSPASLCSCRRCGRSRKHRRGTDRQAVGP